MLRLRKLETRTNSILHVIHIADTRTKRAYIDGLSRGDLPEGMMAEKNPLEFGLLKEEAGQRAGDMLEE